MKEHYKYGIFELPNECDAYAAGYRYAVYKKNTNDESDIRITKWLKECDLQKFSQNI